MADFVPRNEPLLLGFLRNYAAKAKPYATAAGVPEVEIDGLISRIGTYCDASETLEQDRATMQKRTLTRTDDRVGIVADLRAVSGRIKAAPGGDAAAKDLQILGSSDEAARRDNTPEVTVEDSPKGPVISFTNPTRQGVNVYRRVVGVDEAPEFLARDTRSPYIDTEKFGKPVERQYHVVPVYNDEEVGDASDTVTITTGG